MDAQNPPRPDLYRISWQHRHAGDYMQRITSTTDPDDLSTLLPSWEGVALVMLDPGADKGDKMPRSGINWVYTQSHELVQLHDGVEAWRRQLPNVNSIQAGECDLHGQVTKCVLVETRDGHQLIHGSSGRVLEVIFGDILETGFSAILVINQPQQQLDPVVEIECSVFPETRSEAGGGGSSSSSKAGLDFAMQSIDHSLLDHDSERVRLEEALVGKYELVNHCLDTLSGVLSECFIADTSSSHTDAMVIQRRQTSRKRRIERLRKRLVPIFPSAVQSRSDQRGQSTHAKGDDDASPQCVMVLERLAGSIATQGGSMLWFQVNVQNIGEKSLDHVTMMVRDVPFRSNSVHGVARGHMATLFSLVMCNSPEGLASMVEGHVCVQYSIRGRANGEAVSLGWEYQSFTPQPGPLDASQCRLLESLTWTL
ncbi:hypothetical protein DFQ27_005322 [Actinomortierella ambigua]|uniref:Uncharacterized protein n=1 Tax=Actinomortierella ambigua TaxID=1343610 RepID=A0A9P6Q2L8_9FUNG|nr:hypothetical protein DFQ27_005322 [Actinomortierella ambigua]